MKKKSAQAGSRPIIARAAGELNAAQQQAVGHGRSPLLIIAGAGTGKTLTLAHRVARLIGAGVPAERILRKRMVKPVPCHRPGGGWLVVH